MNTNFKITNLECEACVKLSENALKRIAGVSAVSVDPKSGQVSVESENSIAWEEIVQALDKVGKTVTQ